MNYTYFWIRERLLSRSRRPEINMRTLLSVFCFLLTSLSGDELNPLTSEWALRALIDFTLSNARGFYSSMGNPLAGKGLTEGGGLLVYPEISLKLSPSISITLQRYRILWGIYFSNSTNQIWPDYQYNKTNESLVSKETEVPHRWGIERIKFDIKQVDWAVTTKPMFRVSALRLSKQKKRLCVGCYRQAKGWRQRQ